MRIYICIYIYVCVYVYICVCVHMCYDVIVPSLPSRKFLSDMNQWMWAIFGCHAADLQGSAASRS